MKRVSRFRRIVPWFAAGALAVPAIACADASVQSLAEIRAAAQAFVKKHVPRQEPGTIQVNVGTLDPRLRLAPCPDPLHVSLPPGGTFRARMTLAVSCPSGASWTIYVPVTIETHTSVLVMRRAAARGSRLTAADVEVQTRVVSGPGEAYLTDVAELSGRTLRRPLSAGAALTVDAMADEVLVKRGQRVTLLAEAGGLEVRAAGLAMGNAAAADRVKVQNLSSRRIVEGVVESADVIRITP